MKPISHPVRLLVLVFAILAGSPSLRAQQPAAAETLQQQQQTPRYQTSAEPLATDTSSSEVGQISEVQRFPKPDMFTVAVSQQVFYTDNVFYADTNPVGSAAYFGSYNLSYVPYATRDWTPRLSLQYNMVRYDRVAAGDFDNENLVVSSTYVFSDDRAWSWTAAIDLSRFTSPHRDDQEFYQEVVYDNHINHIQALAKDLPLYFISSYDLIYHQTNPGIFDRLDNVLSFSLSYFPIPQLRVGPFVRPASRIYFNDAGPQHGRSDFNLSEGIDVAWNPVQYLTVSADVIHTDDYSNNQGLNYTSTIPGFALTGTFSF